MSDGPYFTWREAVQRPIWKLDRHWYVLLARLAVGLPRPRRARVRRLYVRNAFEDVAAGGDARAEDEEPYVCPGCYAVDAPCAPGCIDAAIEADRERNADRFDEDADEQDEDEIVELSG